MPGTVLCAGNAIGNNKTKVIIRPYLYFGQIKFWQLVEMKEDGLGLENLGSNPMPLVC